MRRRRLLAAVVGLPGLAGCLGRSRGEDSVTAEVTATPPLAERGRPPDICRRPPKAPDFHIRAIVEPRFAPDWSPVTGRSLSSDTVVVGLARAGRSRAYPIPVLWDHEVVNDRFAGTPLLVTYCSICNSGMVAERRVDGEATRFGVSGLLWTPPSAAAARSRSADRVFGAARTRTAVRATTDRNLVMYDELTASYWSQLLARGLCGRARGKRLTIVPSRVATWADWRAAHPDTEVLLPAPHSTARNPPIP